MHDVAVVGFGPVGAALANLLGRLGVRTVVLEREAATYHLPRAVHFDDEVMRIFRGIGRAAAAGRGQRAYDAAIPGYKFAYSPG